MKNLKRERPGKTEHYLNRAKVAAERSTCLRRKVGAVIIRNDTEVSSGYVGSPRDTDNCIDLGTCIRIELAHLPANATSCAAASTPNRMPSSTPHGLVPLYSMEKCISPAS